MKYTAGKVLRMFATSKGPDQMLTEVNMKTSFDFPGQWIWLKTNDLILDVQSENKVNRERKQNIWKWRSAVRGAGPLGGSDPAPKEVNRKGCSSLPCTGLCCHITEAPLLFFPLTMHTACIRTVHCFHFLSALRWLKMHNYHQFAALLWKVPKLSLWRKLCHCLRHALAVPCPWYLYPPFPKLNISPLFCFTKKWVVCLFLWFVLDCFWRIKRGKKKRRNWLCRSNMTTKWGFKAEKHSLLKHLKAVFSPSHGIQVFSFCAYCVTIFLAFFLLRLKGQKTPPPKSSR